MKIPETSANIGAYYGNEENGQWQPNGVIIDNGVGGGVVGSGDAGMHRPPVYPVHIPRGHVPAGYVMAGAYYGAPYAAVPPPQPEDFTDYMWMENEEEFDKQVLQQLEEEALMEQCIEAMLEDEQREMRANRENRHNYPTTSNGNPPVSLEEAVSRSTLNPLAAEFVPTRRRQPTAPSAPPAVPSAPPAALNVPPVPANPPPAVPTVTPIATSAPPRTEESPEPTAPSAQEEAPSPKEEESRTVTESAEEKESRIEVTEETKTEEPLAPPKDPPEVSALDIHLKQPKKDLKKQPEVKKQTKVEPKKKPVAIVVKSETKVQPKKKDVKEVKAVKSEVKTVKSESRVEERSEEVVVDVPKPQTLIVEEVPSTPGLKPINYAAAAKASKPKPKSMTPPVEKPAQPAQPIKTEKKIETVKEKPKMERVDKKIVPKEKSLPKDVKVQRKNSAK